MTFPPLSQNQELSFLSFYPEGGCHLLACQFEEQWPTNPANNPQSSPTSDPLQFSKPRHQLFTHPIERAMQAIALWHLPLKQQLCLIDESKEEAHAFSEWIDKEPLLSEVKARLRWNELPIDRPIALWGSSPLALDYLKERDATPLAHPPLASIAPIHDKRFIEGWRGTLTPTKESRPYEFWIQSLEQLKERLAEPRHRGWIIKRPWSSAGRGNLCLDLQSLKEPAIERQVKRFFALDGGTILQPFVERVVDFSSLWFIHPPHSSGEIEFFSTTRMNTTDQGRYLGCWLGPIDQLLPNYQKSLAKHYEEAKELLQELKRLGYWGAVGLDAMIYRDGDHDSLESELKTSIIEINARQTLGMHLESVKRSLYSADQLVEARVVTKKSTPSNSLKLLPPNKANFNLTLIVQ